MSGLRKAKKYDWKDSNLALFGSDLEKNIKKESAETEEAWQGSGQKPGLRIWRVVKFKIVDWPEEDYGRFYSGDSYIILNTYKPNPESEELAYDVHFWIGEFSTQDEYGTAAYKTVELDHFLNDAAVQHREVAGRESKDEYGTAAYKTVELDHFLDDKPVQHREVMNHESPMFKEYFDRIELLKGGADTGFRHVTPEEYKSRLLRYKRVGRKVHVSEHSLKESNLNDGDVFILDKGLVIYQWNGRDANKDEKFQALQFVEQLKSERNGRPQSHTLEQDGISKDHDFYESLADDETDGDEVEDEEGDYSGRPKKMLKLSDASGNLVFEELSGFDRSMLNTNDAFVVDTGEEVIVWIGSGASKSEKSRGFEYAQLYLLQADAKFLPLTVVSEGQICAALDNAF